MWYDTRCQVPLTSGFSGSLLAWKPSQVSSWYNGLHICYSEFCSLLQLTERIGCVCGWQQGCTLSFAIYSFSPSYRYWGETWLEVGPSSFTGRVTRRFHPLLDTCSSCKQHGAAEGALIPSGNNPLPVWVLRENSCLQTFLQAEKDSDKKRSVCRVQTWTSRWNTLTESIWD